MIEVCCGSFEDAMMASECGIKRVELNSALSLGGLTPSLGSLIMIKQYSDIEIVSMVRARAGGFCYTNYQYEQMLENLKLLLAYGTDGVSFGFLNEDRTIDKNRCQEFLENVKNEGRKATFHRAFDCTRDPYEAIETLIDLGFDRLLTSGQEATAEEGIHLLADLQKKYGNQIEIIAGCGVNENNAQKKLPLEERQEPVRSVHLDTLARSIHLSDILQRSFRLLSSRTTVLSVDGLQNMH